MSAFTSGYTFNQCGCPHLSWTPSWDKHTTACQALLDFVHKLMHKTKTEWEIYQEFQDSEMWDDDGGAD